MMFLFMMYSDNSQRQVSSESIKEGLFFKYFFSKKTVLSLDDSKWWTAFMFSLKMLSMERRNFQICMSVKKFLFPYKFRAAAYRMDSKKLITKLN